MALNPDRLTARQRAYVAAIAAGMTPLEAAAALGIGARTARRYGAEPMVRAAITAAQDDALAQVSARMNAGSNAALDVLHALMTDAAAPASVRLRAAQVWLDVAFRARELVDLVARVTDLEQRAAVAP